MKTQEAVLWEAGSHWSVEEVDLADPLPGEVRVKLAASGMCHSDEHLLTGDLPAPLPIVGGHEGAGYIEAVGKGVTSVKEGDPVVLSFIPSCGKCRACSTGHQNLCELGALILSGSELAGGQRITARGQGVGTMCCLGTFSPYVVAHENSVVKVRGDIPLDKAALVGCGVTTGYGSSVYTAEVKAGDILCVIGVGGIGMNAVQGGRIAGARYIVAIDPTPSKLDAAKRFGATHTASSIDEARAIVLDISDGNMADAAVIAIGVGEGEMIASAMGLIGKNGRLVMTAISPLMQIDAKISLLDMTLFQKQLRGSIFGSANPRYDIPRLLDLYRDGILKLDDLITKTYTLDQINEGYADMRDGKNIRGLILFD